MRKSYPLACRWLLFGVWLLCLVSFNGSLYAAEEGVPPPAPSDGIAGFFHTIGIIGIIILLLSLVLVAMIVWLLMDLKSGIAIPLDFVTAFEEAIAKRRFKDAFELAKTDDSMIARVLTAGMARLQYGLQEAREAAAAMTESLKAQKDHIVAYMATIGTLGPLFGLVGTVYGMIMSFGELGKGGAPNPSALAGGISHALYVTLLGISLSLPAIFFYSFFRNRTARIAIDVSLMTDDLLTQMYHSSRRSGSDAAIADAAAKNVAGTIPPKSPEAP